MFEYAGRCVSERCSNKVVPTVSIKNANAPPECTGVTGPIGTLKLKWPSTALPVHLSRRSWTRQWLACDLVTKRKAWCLVLRWRMQVCQVKAERGTRHFSFNPKHTAAAAPNWCSTKPASHQNEGPASTRATRPGLLQTLIAFKHQEVLKEEGGATKRRVIACIKHFVVKYCMLDCLIAFSATF